MIQTKKHILLPALCLVLGAGFASAQSYKAFDFQRGHSRGDHNVTVKHRDDHDQGRDRKYVVVRHDPHSKRDCCALEAHGKYRHAPDKHAYKQPQHKHGKHAYGKYKPKKHPHKQYPDWKHWNRYASCRH
ncbi:hypothetical protein [Coraliomargarita parva]|uniref:hypothetical protein n=1 Tax=Coraliomargarita parva TaxID=3014050 RepID=UPI0022B3AB06|nr:hypothetical protein [Coraliomargarita parva]